METLFSKTFDERIMNVNTLIITARCIMNQDVDAAKEILARTAKLLTCDATQIGAISEEIKDFIDADMYDVVATHINEILIRVDPAYLDNTCSKLREFCDCYIKLMRIRRCPIRSIESKLKECLTYLGSADITASELLNHVLAIRKSVYRVKNITQYGNRQEDYNFLLDMCEQLDQFKSQLDEYIKIVKVEGDNNA